MTEMRVLESWHDEDASPIDEASYIELADPSNANGWSADEMFKYNERMHKITSNYSEKTLTSYTTPLPENNSKYSIKLASKLAKEIEDKVLAEGRITPESSDDDELFEKELKQKRSTCAKSNRQQRSAEKLMSHLKNLHRQNNQAAEHRLSNGNGSNNTISNKDFLASLISSPLNNNNHNHFHHNSSGNNAAANITTNSNATTHNGNGKSKDNKTASQRASTRYNNSTTDITSTASRLSSSLTINEAIMKPTASSSRNILRTCLTNRANICV